MLCSMFLNILPLVGKANFPVVLNKPKYYVALFRCVMCSPGAAASG